MSEKPRRWFQIHLSTAVVLMFVAGGLTWANLTECSAPFNESAKKFHHGWPFIADSKYVPMIVDGPDWHWWHYQGLIADGLIGCAIIMAVAQVSEYLIRRREVRKP